jgi:hypothetical protein
MIDRQRLLRATGQKADADQEASGTKSRYDKTPKS